ncbi:hypothetical protein TNCV_1264281 [Trichonephila clavipes]|nr:hypothetical protein TNCV_1264281 [Trichonephila clavipes]
MPLVVLKGPLWFGRRTMGDDPTGLAYPKSGLEFVRKPLRRVGLPNSGRSKSSKSLKELTSLFLQAEGKKVPLSIIQTFTCVKPSSEG